jgi:hypothetical protein
VIPDIVAVTWTDAAHVNGPWRDREDVIGQTRNALPELIRSVGYLIDDTPAGILVCSSFNPSSDDVSGCVSIPRAAIVTVVRLPLDRDDAA